MRSVDVVKQKRNELRSDMENFLEVKNRKYPAPTRYYELDGYDKHEFNYIMNCINNLRNQINALEFVLNEDTELTDYTISFSPTHKELGITKEKVFSSIENNH